MAFLSPWSELPVIASLMRRGHTAMRSYQQRRLLRLVSDVYSASPFYRRYWDDAGFNPGRLGGFGDLSRIPTITKQQCRVLASELERKPPVSGRLIWHDTSGSTGEPFRMVRSWWEERFLTLVRTRALRSLGFHARLRQARIRVPADFDWLDDRPLRVLNALGFFRSRVFSCYEPAERLWRQVRDFSPDVVMGYSETMARTARYGLDAGLLDIRPRFVLVGGEVCTPLMRRQISEAFQAPVYETYATTEFNLVGWTCPQTGLLHLCDPTVLVEVLDGQGREVAEGEAGKIVVTALHSRVMPFVRYVLGDRVVKGPAPCPCGAPFGTLRSVDGREIDRLRLGNGGTLHAYVLLNIFLDSDTRWMRQYQLVQDETGVIDARIWPLRNPSPEALALLKSRLEEKTAGTEVRVTLVDSMELSPSGKFRLCRSTGD